MTPPWLWVYWGSTMVLMLALESWTYKRFKTERVRADHAEYDLGLAEIRLCKGDEPPARIMWHSNGFHRESDCGGCIAFVPEKRP